MTKITFPVEASHIMMFARSIGDTNPVYYDAEAAKKSEAGRVIAPPSFAQSVAQFNPDYFLRPKPGQAWFGSGFCSCSASWPSTCRMDVKYSSRRALSALPTRD